MASSDEINDVSEKVKEYAEISKTIKVTQEKLKILNKKKNELGKDVLPKLKTNNVTKCNLSFGTLKVIKTPNAENPLAHGKKALLTIDVWEHAYYIDFKNARPGFIKNFLDNLVNWDFVAANFAKA
jgi:superoxide dismutase